MPNHIRNALTVRGNPNRVAEFIEAAKKHRPLPAPSERDLEAFEKGGHFPRCPECRMEHKKGEPCKEREPVVFDFHGIVPLPDEYADVPYSPNYSDGRGIMERKSDNGYDMEVTTWGIKWGPYDVDEEGITHEPGLFTIRFTTAWGPATVFIGKAASLWPDLEFRLSWGGEGPIRGRAMATYDEVDVLVDEADEGILEEVGPCPDEDGDDYDEEYWERYNEAEYRYVNEHEDWIASVIRISK